MLCARQRQPRERERNSLAHVCVCVRASVRGVGLGGLLGRVRVGRRPGGVAEIVTPVCVSPGFRGLGEMDSFCGLSRCTIVAL